MKIKIIEAGLLLAILVFFLNCSIGKCLGPEAKRVTCLQLSDIAVITTTSYYIDGTTDEDNDLSSSGKCPPSTNGSGGPLPSPNTADSIPSAANSLKVRFHRNDAGSGTTAGGFLAVPWLNLPFTALTPAMIQQSTSCSSSQPDVLIVDHADAVVTRFGTCPLAVKATIPVVSRPLEVVVTPDGTQAVVSNYDNYVSFINLQNNTVSNLSTGNSNPSGVAISPDGKTAYVTNFSGEDPAVMVINIASHAITNTIPVNTQWPHSLALTPDGSQLWVADPLSSNIQIIDTLTSTVIRALSVGAPYGIDFSPNGTVAYVASAGSNPGSLLAIDTRTFQVVNSWTVGSLPDDVSVTYGGNQVIVTNYLSNSVSVVSTQTGQVTTGAPLQGPPMGLARIQ